MLVPFSLLLSFLGEGKGEEIPIKRKAAGLWGLSLVVSCHKIKAQDTLTHPTTIYNKI